MTATAHALVAGAIAAHFPQPATAIPIALASHYVMDSIPHWDFGTNWRTRSKKQTGIMAVTETCIGVAITLFYYRSFVALPLLGATIVASLLPDWLETPWYILYADAKKHAPARDAGRWEKIIYRLYKGPNIFHTKASLPFGIITQIATVIFFLAILK